jgi:hypothetical protein
MDRSRERLLYVHVLAHSHRRHGDDGMRVIRRRDGDRVDASAFPLEHLPKVAILLRGREAGIALLSHAVIHVAHRDDVLAAHAVDVAASHTTDADARDVERIARRTVAAAEHVARNDREDGARLCDVGDEVAPGNVGHDQGPAGEAVSAAAASPARRRASTSRS